MMAKQWLATVAVCGLMTACTNFGVYEDNHAHRESTPHWSYSGANGPAQWGRLSPEFAQCDSGKAQSPINLTNLVEGNLPPLEFSYVNSASNITHNGHTVQVNYPTGNLLSVGEKTYQLVQVHFHAPSENTLSGVRFPMEGHWVHADEAGNLAVVAVMFVASRPNSRLASLWTQLPRRAGDTFRLRASNAADALLPKRLSYYRFDGSLTTPPCSEGVKWMVLRQPVQVSRGQIAQFQAALSGPNNRPLQALNTRVVQQ